MSRSSRNSHPNLVQQAPEADSAGAYDGPSKSQLKREMTALQQLGERLVRLPAAKLVQLPLSERLHEAIREAQRITAREAKRRQLQYVGKLMRDADAATITTQLSQWESGSDHETEHFHAIERWRQRLLDDDATLTEFVRHAPQTNIQHMRALIRAARKEAADNAALPEGREPQRKHFRALFQEVRRQIEAHETSHNTDAPHNNW